ncbi:helix-turn-helix domain-containing protein [Mycobacterium europaeum]|uniref:helix-turn-helix domain-containing protein n=1 Tax=Mycobacterium europaeum TaxID=761804 RepID=UPI00142F3492|nr:helix-turn-helix transcriptional regulator [Mycobacterium europaeum]
MSAESWEKSLAARVGAAVRSLRGKGRSAQWLADATKALGYPIGRATISEIERGSRRTITVAELLILARALNTSPTNLMYPDPQDDDPTQVVEVLPDVRVTEFQAAQWFSGHRHGFTDTKDGAESRRLRDEFQANTRELRLWRKIGQYRDRLSAIAKSPGGELTDDQRRDKAFYEAEIADLRTELGAANNGDD